ncbi:sugar-binding transcriptional regulator [Frigoribacterium sp. CG_9.8]|uniref:sugar-binding transcriptional regulator n=1 Tax=Frigoribacterium sp. CG_9.8 TaxID=2787733 RepID=UPI0018CA7D3C|nr:sugar-binding domain-containing protein [Frigoribacterium sp. CG_9.8]MBG6106692.1 DNA-binding transcriptional regulator LsrR (DeoR family) [Frigoribacterium sp. CG_9.8]
MNIFENEGDGRTAEAMRAAHLYYIQNLTMDAIASELTISRSSVSRLIAFARDSGLVEIRLHSPIDQLTQLQHQLHDRFGLTAHIVPTGDAVTEIDRLDRVAMSAARILTDFVDSTMIVGVAWGSTIASVSRHLVRKPVRNTQVVQLNGAGNAHTTGLVYASEIIGRFGAAFGATVQQFPVPAFFDDPATKEAFWRERSTARVLAVQRRMDVAVFGIGSPSADVPSHVYAGGYLDRADYDDLARAHVVGDIATIFFRADGSHNDIPLNARSSGPGFTVLMKAPRRIAVVSGQAKLAALRGAVATGVITDLVVDEITAGQLAAMD